MEGIKVYSMQGRAWAAGLIGLLGVLLAVGLISPGAMASSDQDLRTLWVENRIAEDLVRLKLTPGQREELKQALENITASRAEARSHVTGLLAQRRDALLGGDHSKVKEVDRQLRQAVLDGARSTQKALSGFVDGLTERQKEVLGRVLGIRSPQNAAKKPTFWRHQREIHDREIHERRNFQRGIRREVQREIRPDRRADRQSERHFLLRDDRMEIVLNLLEKMN